MSISNLRLINEMNKRLDWSNCQFAMLPISWMQVCWLQNFLFQFEVNDIYIAKAHQIAVVDNYCNKWLQSTFFIYVHDYMPKKYKFALKRKHCFIFYRWEHLFIVFWISFYLFAFILKYTTKISGTESYQVWRPSTSVQTVNHFKITSVAFLFLDSIHINIGYRCESPFAREVGR